MIYAGQPDNLGLIPIIDRDFTLLHNLQNNSATHSATYRIATVGSLPNSEAVGAWCNNSPLTRAEVKNAPKLYVHYPI